MLAQQAQGALLRGYPTAPFDFIVGCKLPKQKEVSEEVLARTGRYRLVADNTLDAHCYRLRTPSGGRAKTPRASGEKSMRFRSSRNSKRSNRQSLNILFLVPGWYPPVRAGVKANARTLVGQLATQHAVTVFIVNWNYRTPVEALDDNGVRIIERRLRAPVGHHSPLRTFLGWLMDVPSFLMQFRKICSDHKIDVIHIHQMDGLWFNVAIAAFFGIPAYTVGLHGGEVRGYAKSGFLSRQCFRFILRHAFAMIAVSNELGERARTLFPGTDVVVIRNGIPEAVGGEIHESEWRCDDLEIPRSYFLSVGSLLQVKGHDVAVRSWRHVLRAHPDCHLLIVGDGERRGLLERLITECECEARVHLLGTQTPDTIRRLMSRACGLVHPSRHEGFSIVLLEAGITGCPVIATNVGGISELIESEKSGLLVEPENEDELACAVVRVLTDRSLALKMADCLAGRIRAEFTASAMAEKYVAIFRAATEVHVEASSDTQPPG